MAAPTPIGDDEQLRQLGFSPSFRRSMSLWENFSLGFTYLSPVVGVYTLFAAALSVGGPPMLWSYLLVGAGQFFVCLVFCEIVSQYPVTGGVYPWVKRLVGPGWAWMTGWIYLWALWTTIAAVAVGAAPYVASVLGFGDAGPGYTTWTAAALVIATTALNLRGTKLLARFALFGFIAELAGALLVGGYLLLFARVQPLGVLFDTYGIALNGSYLPAFLAASLAGIFQYYGFEACGDVAEEVANPSIRIPKAMRMTIYIGGAAATFVCLAFVLAVPDIGKVISGASKNPVGDILESAFGPVGARLVMFIVTISFLSCILSLQAATSRLLFAFGRDRVVAGNEWLCYMSRTSRVPIYALLVSGAVPLAVVFLGYFLQDALTTIISFAAVGIYIAFQMVVAAAIIARAGGWRPSGAFRLGRWGWPVTVMAQIYGVLAIINIAWPRSPESPWFINYGVVLTTIVFVCLGLAAGRRSEVPLGHPARREQA